MGSTVQSFDWDYIHDNCDLNLVRDELWLHSRFFGLRFTRIIGLIENGYYFESLLMMILLLEQVLASKCSKLNARFEELINSAYIGSKKETATRIKELRNKMAHRYLFKYYVSFEKGKEYPLSEMSNYEFILFKLFLPIISCLTNQYEYAIDFVIGEYTINDLAAQFGIEKEIDKIMNVGVVTGMSNNMMMKIRAKNEMNIMRWLNNTSPVYMFQSIYESLFESEDTKK